MRTTTQLSIAALALTTGLIACGHARANDSASQDDLKRDLQLASTSNLDLASPKVDPSLLTLEGQPRSTPSEAKTVRKGAGDRAVRSKSPTVRATPETDVAALDETDQVETLAQAPAPDLINEPVAVAPRPAPVVQTGGAGDYGTGSNGGVFGGGMGGVVIRGGGVDGDHCEIHGAGGRTARFPVYGVPRTPTYPVIGGGMSTPRGGGTGRMTPRPPSSPSGSSPRMIMRPHGR